MRGLRLGIALCCLAGTPEPVRAGQGDAAEATAPDSAVEVVSPIEETLTVAEPEELTVVKRLSERVEDQPPVIRDAQFRLNFRTYSFERETVAGRRDFANAFGGEVFFETGAFARIVKVGVSYYSSNLIGDSENPGRTGLVGPGGEDLNVLGQAFVKIGRESGWRAILGRQGTKAPYLDTDDSRMIPRTHELYQVARLGGRARLGLAHARRTKLKDSEEFIPMSVAAGAPDTDEGVSIIGGKYELGGSATLGVYNLYGWNTFNTLYAEGTWASYLLRSAGAKVSAQYTDQRSVGDELVGDFRSWHGGLKLSGSVQSAVLTLAYTQVGEGASIRFPWGGFPSYNWGMLEDFNRPGERAFRVGVSLSGATWGADAWSGFVNLTGGYDARESDTGAALPDVVEGAFTIDFKPRSGNLEGLWVRFRAGRAEFEDGADVTNSRIIVNYSLPFL